jgi:hypothetical protein
LVEFLQFPLGQLKGPSKRAFVRIKKSCSVSRAQSLFLSRCCGKRPYFVKVLLSINRADAILLPQKMLSIREDPMALIREKLSLAEMQGTVGREIQNFKNRIMPERTYGFWKAVVDMTGVGAIYSFGVDCSHRERIQEALNSLGSVMSRFTEERSEGKISGPLFAACSHSYHSAAAFLGPESDAIRNEMALKCGYLFSQALLFSGIYAGNPLCTVAGFVGVAGLACASLARAGYHSARTQENAKLMMAEMAEQQFKKALDLNQNEEASKKTGEPHKAVCNEDACFADSTTRSVA